MLHRIALLAIRAPRRILAVAVLTMISAAIFGIPVAKSLSAGGFQDPTSESARATQMLADKFHQGDMQLVFTVTAPGGANSAAARAAGLATYAEIFADRGYTPEGQLVPRSQPGAMIEHTEEAAARLLHFLDTGRMKTVDGGEVPLDAVSICIHGDSDHAVAMARGVRRALEQAGVTLKSFLPAERI